MHILSFLIIMFNKLSTKLQIVAGDSSRTNKKINIPLWILYTVNRDSILISMIIICSFLKAHGFL